MTLLATLLWRGHLNVWLSALLLLVAAIWLRFLYRRLLARLPWPRALLLLAPKILVVVLLITALFEPVFSHERHDASKGRLLALVDVSSSMDLADDGRQPRLARARHILEMIRDNLPGDIHTQDMR